VGGGAKGGVKIAGLLLWLNGGGARHLVALSPLAVVVE
jgi:hypothetical protein